MHTAFFDERDEQYRPGPDAQLCSPEAVAGAVVFALSQPDGCDVKELVVAASTESLALALGRSRRSSGQRLAITRWAGSS